MLDTTDNNPPVITATAGTYNFQTIKGFTYDTSVSGTTFATVSNLTDDITSSEYNYEMYFDDVVDENGNKIPVSTYNGLTIDPQTGAVSGAGAEYSDNIISGEIKVTFNYTKSGVEHSISTVKPITIFVNAYISCDYSSAIGWPPDTYMPNIFVADETDSSVLRSARTGSTCIIKAVPEISLNGKTLINNYILFASENGTALGYCNNIFQDKWLIGTEALDNGNFANYEIYDITFTQNKYYINESKSADENILGTYIYEEGVYPPTFINANNNNYKIEVTNGEYQRWSTEKY